MPRIPDRWEMYSKFGKIIKGTRFMACKTPLKHELTVSVADDMRFTPHDLIEAVPRIGLVIDFTNTNRYYNPNDFNSFEGVEYRKINTEGRVVPHRSIVSSFFKIVDAFLKDSSKKHKVIVAHCTHGVNRTGYLLCRYMVVKLNFPPQVAIDEYGKARGHVIERQNYITDLLNIGSPNLDNAQTDNKLNDSSKVIFPHSKKNKQNMLYQQDRVYFSNNAFDSQRIQNYPHQPAPYQQRPYQQVPYEQRPYQQVPYEQRPYQQEPYQYRPYQQVPYGQRPYQQQPYQYRPDHQAPYESHQKAPYKRTHHKAKAQNSSSIQSHQSSVYSFEKQPNWQTPQSQSHTRQYYRKSSHGDWKHDRNDC